MPELPEVETVRHTLKKYVVGKTIDEVEVFWKNIIVGDIQEFKNQLIGQTIHDIDRVGKYLIFKLDTIAFVSHLRMEGKYFINKDHDPFLKHTHVVFHFTDGTQLRYHDTRKFGRMEIVSLQNYRQQAPLNQLGKEPFDIDVKTFYQRIHKSSLPIKTVLLDQKIIAGLGNIYVNEVLFYSQIHPETKANTITKKQAQHIVDNSVIVLDKAIGLGGTTIDTFDSNGIHGRFQNHLLVHGKTGDLCPHCGETIQKIVVGGRGTYFCPQCQKKKKR